jgi:hypothetical protein
MSELRTVLPVAVGIRDSVVQLVPYVGGVALGMPPSCS